MSSWLESRNCVQCMIYSESRRKFNKLRLDAISILDYVICRQEHTSHVIFLMHFARLIVCILTAWLKTSQGSKVSQCAFHSIFMPSMMSCVWAFVGRSLFLSLVSLRLLPLSLPHSTCSWPGTPSSMSTPPRVKTTALTQNEEYVLPHGDIQSQAPRRLRPLRDSCNDLPGSIWRHRYGAFVLVWRGTRRWAYRKSAIFTNVHSGTRRTSEPETSLSLSWRKFVASSVLFRTHKNEKTRIRT